MMKKNIAFLFCVMLLGCSPKKIDLNDLVLAEKPSVDLTEFTKDIREQKGRFEMPTKDGVQLIDKGEKIVYYFFVGNDNVTFDKVKIAPVLETKVVIYNGDVSFVSVHPDNKEALNLLKSMLQRYSTPDSVIYSQRKFDGAEKGLVEILKGAMPNLVKEVTDEFDNKAIQYPQQIFWSKNDVLTQLTMDPTGSNLNLAVKIVTKKAYMDHIVQEYAKPLLKEYDSPYQHLFKK